MISIPLEEKALRKAYADACEERDAMEKKIAPLKKTLAAAVEKAELARVEAMRAREALDEARGGTAWFDLKRSIGAMATLIGEGKFAKGDGNGTV